MKQNLNNKSVKEYDDLAIRILQSNLTTKQFVASCSR